MRQILRNESSVFVARMPRPSVRPGCVLVQVSYSAVSVGTEIVGLGGNASEPIGLEKIELLSKTFSGYCKKALKNPTAALRRVRSMARTRLMNYRNLLYKNNTLEEKNYELEKWNKVAAVKVEQQNKKTEVLTDDSAYGYQIQSQSIETPANCILSLEILGEVEYGKISIGLLNDNHTQWVDTAKYFDAGSIDDKIIFEIRNTSSVTITISNAGNGSSLFQIQKAKISIGFSDSNGTIQNELNQMGWNLGYSTVGEVIAVGEGVNNFVPGEKVACAGAGYANHADFVVVPKNLVCHIPKNCDLTEAAFATIGSIALQGVRRASPSIGETIAVIGLGLLGQITMQLLRANGCTVIGLDLSDRRLHKALETGMEAGTTDPEQFKKLIFDYTNGLGADRTLITAASRSDSIINLSMHVTRRKGTVIIVGDISLKIERTQFYQKEIDLLMSTSYGAGRYDAQYEEKGIDYPYAYVRWTLNRNMQAFLQLIQQKRIQISSLIERIVPIEEASIAYKELAKGGEDCPLGVLIEYPQDTKEYIQSQESTWISPAGHRKAKAGLINYVLVGVGSFGTSMLVPQMDRRKDLFFLKGVVSRDSVRAGNYARLNRLEIISTDLTSTLNDHKIDLVVIATRHNEHAKQVVEALHAGKNVFVEKPLALNWEELKSIISAYDATNNNVILMVGYNRRFSPAMQTLKTIMQSRKNPIMIHYRLNGGYIPGNHWIQMSEGGGRNLGEACHMYDCFRFLIGHPVASIQATAIAGGDSVYFKNDNFTATMGYEDGSVATLTYTALGPKEKLSKEKIEIFCDGEAYILEDYKVLTRASDETILWSSKEADKGHYHELCALGEAIYHGKESPIPFGELIETSSVALHIEELMGGGVVACHEEDLRQLELI